MRVLAVAVVMFIPLMSQAEEQIWSHMTGEDIETALTGRTLDYGGQWQEFRASGRTLYHNGRDSWGYWAVRGTSTAACGRHLISGPVMACTVMATSSSLLMRTEMLPRASTKMPKIKAAVRSQRTMPVPVCGAPGICLQSAAVWHAGQHPAVLQV